ncbi:DNA polymerase IV [Clostridium sp. A1-XYC3]|uniref:DNA polymerase IV n=1 Tax=Clostridium tanneri TaxID=3037988 RepID=A0ABU4JRC7_9CLOT|nr:DNA polymerase IV [Clostridium sp. A1-XYC3]MDW8800694.1 DNA polymerase IV [Clostridium sp. A1-XYC3]
MNKVIMHVDMDAFFASVEIVDNKNLRGKPVIIGGNSNRGVVATCSYEARAYGVRSAMPIYMAKEKCPNAIILPVRYGRYKEISNKIFNIFYEITPYVEPLSIDEAYLDITDINKRPLDMANFVKNRVRKETGLTISAGLSYNKFLAKLASDWNKPNGLKIIGKDEVPKILFPLSIDKVHGLGKKSAKKLNNIGVYTIEELYKLPQDLLVEFFGKFGIDIYDRIRGIDKREVQILRERKSIGRETTLSNDTNDKEELKLYIKAFAGSIADTLENKNVKGKNITIKTKTSSFVNHTKSKTLSYYISNEEDIYREACSILEELEFEEKIRLIGISISAFKEDKVEQLSFF